MPASKKEHEGWGDTDKFTVVMETAGFHETELSAYCRERGLFTEQVGRWRQAAQDGNAQPVLTMAEQKELVMLRAQDKRKFEALKKKLERKEKAMAEMAALLMLQEKVGGLRFGGRERLTSTSLRDKQG